MKPKLQKKSLTTVRPVIEGLEPRKLLSASTLNTLAFFNYTDGANPNAGVTFDSSGDLFGTTQLGGANGYGTVFEIAQGTTSITTLGTFNLTNGANPFAGVTLDSSGDLFGTTLNGGATDGGVGLGNANGDGTVFEIPQGSNSITTLASFNSADGANPLAGVTLDSSGDLFGTTYVGGPLDTGTVFEIARGTTSITTLASFNDHNGFSPEAGVTLDSSGDLFGTAEAGGAYGEVGVGDGTVFEVAAGTTFITTLASFNGTDGANPYAGVTLDASGDLFGTTAAGGAYDEAEDGDGTVFEIAADTNSITTLVSFNGTEGSAPQSGVTFDSSGDLFGTTFSGGTNGVGTTFEIAQGTTSITTLASFNYGDGEPLGNVALDSSGDVFGTTFIGGNYDDVNSYHYADGTVFELTSGSAPPSTGAAAELTFLQQPVDVATGATISAPVTVDVDDSSGNLVTTDNSNVTLAIAGGPSGATLAGTTTVAAVGGVATFSDLSIATAGDNYTLTATDGALAPANSAAFNVTTPSPLVPTFGNIGLPSAAVAGLKLKAKVPVVFTNQGSDFKGTVTIDLYADMSTNLDGNQVLVTSLTKKVSLKAHKSQTFEFNIKTLPSALKGGNYHLLAELIDPSSLTNVTATTQTVEVAAAFVQPSLSVGAVIPGRIAFGKSGSIVVTVTNTGNVSAGGLDIMLSPSADGTTSVAGIVLATVKSGTTIPPNKKKTFKLHFKATSALAAGSYYPYLLVSLGGVSTTAVGATQFVVS